jgi:hypothetical protein
MKLRWMKWMVCTAAVFMLSGGTATHAAEAVQDEPSAWARASVNEAIALGLVPERLQSGYQQPITREEFAELIVQTVFAKLKRDAEAAGAAVYWTPQRVLDKVDLDIEFRDAKQTHVKLAYILGSVNGISETEFAPDRHITRQEAATMLINTSHLVNGLRYRSPEALGYADFQQIADWAKPAVQAAAELGYMLGVGGKFDYAGKYTREQSIATMLRLYNTRYVFALRGNIRANAAYEELRYNVGARYVSVSYHDKGAESVLHATMYERWHQHPVTTERKDQFRMERAIAIFAFADTLRPNDYTGILEPTIEGRTSKWDYGWMQVTTFDNRRVLKFEFKTIGGYVSDSSGYMYGYPQVPVSVEQIEAV